MHVVILAGGGGIRLWPLSTKDFPKQFLQLKGTRSLLQQTVERFKGHTIVIATTEAFETLVRDQLKSYEVHVVVEPSRKNTAPAIGLAISYLEKHCSAKEKDPVLIVPSDHLIEPESVFLNFVEQAIHTAEKGKLVTFGIRPTKPEIGYGYIQIGHQLDPFCYAVKRFVEKPKLATAASYLLDPTFYWNSGMFLFTIGTFWNECKKVYPELCELREKEEIFDHLQEISLDYALMEKSENIAVCPLPVSWSDVGSWENLYEVLEKDQNQNVKQGNIIDLSTKNCLIFGGKRVISTLGLEDLVIVDGEEFILIARKNESQRVKEVVQQIYENSHR